MSSSHSYDVTYLSFHCITSSCCPYYDHVPTSSDLLQQSDVQRGQGGVLLHPRAQDWGRPRGPGRHGHQGRTQRAKIHPVCKRADQVSTLFEKCKIKTILMLS